MTLLEMRKKVFSLIEELNEDSDILTDDPDIGAKFLSVTNQIMYELARMKKIPKYVEKKVTKGDLLTMESIGDEIGYDVYQINLVGGVNHQYKADGTMVKFLESGTAEIDVFVYPERITDTTSDNYEFELSADALEIMPYGIAGDLLKSDVSTENGRIYSDRYETMLARLDSRYNMASIYIDGGVSI